MSGDFMGNVFIAFAAIVFNLLETNESKRFQMTNIRRKPSKNIGYVGVNQKPKTPLF